jgi:uncharacterized protein YegJ (DUF2314 family)
MRSALVLAVLIVLGCDRAQAPAAGETVRREGEPDVIGVAGSDVAMNAAMEQARSTLPDFARELASPEEGAFYSIKARFEEGSAVEHIWLVEVAREAGGISGVVNNEPLSITSVALGQRVTVPAESVSDWLIVRDGRYRGGFTIRALREKLSVEERRQMDAELGAVPE